MFSEEQREKRGIEETEKRRGKKKRLFFLNFFFSFLALEKLFEKTKRWADSNHECLLFSNKNHIVSFMSMDPKVMRKNMHPNLLEFLQQNRINVGESLNELSSRHHEILGALTEVYRTKDEAKNMMEVSHFLCYSYLFCVF